MFKKKTTNLQPWVDYFDMLHTFETNGVLEVHAAKGDAYVTQPALHAMTPGDDPQGQIRSGAIAATARRIRTYAAWKAAHEKGLSTFDPETANDPNAPLPEIDAKELMAYQEQLFALHVVRDEYPHDPVYALLLTRERKWWCPWRKTECIEVVNYTENGHDDE